jgi:transcriptional regulator GlxA family with amidase domain
MPLSGSDPLHVSIVALPDAVISTLAGLYDVLNGAAMMGITSPGQRSFKVSIVGEKPGPLWLASGLPIEVQAGVDDVAHSDIVIVPSILLPSSGWERGRYPRLTGWVKQMHRQGARICSACSGVFLLAETGLFDQQNATVHFVYARDFERLFPSVMIHPERVLVISGDREELVSSGASNTWHDLVLYLIAHHVGATVAQEVARTFALQWHQDGLTPFMVFEGRTDHGDAEIAGAQDWLKSNFSVGSPVEEVIRRSRLSERTFKRRFAAATGFSPITYVQRLRIEDAKRRLERTDDSVEDVSWRVGYEDPAFFRRLFKRITGLAPGDYRRRFQIPGFARHPKHNATLGRNEPVSAGPTLSRSGRRS